MELVITSHAISRFVSRLIEAMVKEAYLVPQRTITRLKIVGISLRRIKRENSLYAYDPDLNGLFFLKREDNKIVVTSFIILQPVLGDCLKKLIQNRNLKRVKDEFSLL